MLWSSVIANQSQEENRTILENSVSKSMLWKLCSRSISVSVWGVYRWFVGKLWVHLKRHLILHLCILHFWHSSRHYDTEMVHYHWRVTQGPRMQEFEEEKTNKFCLCLSTTKARVIFCTLYLLNTIETNKWNQEWWMVRNTVGQIFNNVFNFFWSRFLKRKECLYNEWN